jgi:hypothetical protein
MALGDEVKLRVADQRLVELTNPDDTGGGTILASRFDAAVADVEAAFRTYVQVTYDNSDGRHIELAVKGVLIKLEVYKNESGSDKREEAWKRQLEKLRMITHNDRIKPKSSSKLTPADENPTGTEVRPFFDVNDGFTDTTPEKNENRPFRGRTFGA